MPSRGVLERIIPAYAGSTVVSSMEPYLPEDHPRVCGEHSSALKSGQNISGSSPRMRGAQFPNVRLRDTGRIIPAYAGTTKRHGINPDSSKDHPRVCGEHDARNRTLPCWSGSSPRMRGALVMVPTRRSVRRIIPAYAGSTECIQQTMPT